MKKNEFTPEEKEYCMSQTCFNRVHGLAGKDNFLCVACLDHMKKVDEKVTNSEKFREVFGFIPEPEFDCSCAPRKVCNEQKKVHNGNTANMCFDCPFRDWWNKEYKPCFKMKEEFEK